MTIEIGTEDRKLIEDLMKAGRLSSIEDAVHETLQRAMDEQEPTAEYLDYLNESIREGLADLDAGRTVPLEEVLELLRAAQIFPKVAA